MARYYVYEITDPRDGSVFYVGKGSGSRMHMHENIAKSKDSQYFTYKKVHRKLFNKVKKILSLGLSISYGVVYTNSEEEAYELEKEEIAFYGLENLCNIAPGGGGASLSGKDHPNYGKKMSKEQKRKLSESHKGKKLSDKHKRNISKGLKGNVIISQEQRKKISEALTGRKFSDEHKRNISIARKKIGDQISAARSGEKSPTAKLTWEQVRKIREKYKNGGYSHQRIADEYGVGRGCISKIIRGERWKEGN
jgi:hypothetical protein